MIAALETPSSDEVALSIERDEVTLGFICPAIASLLLLGKLDYVPLLIKRIDEYSISLYYAGKHSFSLGPLRGDIVDLVERRSLSLVSLTPPAMNKLWKAAILVEVSP